jgi:broad specificity phosphatase PhoE
MLLITGKYDKHLILLVFSGSPGQFTVNYNDGEKRVKLMKRAARFVEHLNESPKKRTRQKLVLTINNVSVFTLVLTINNVSVFTLVLTMNNVSVFTLVLTINNVSVFTLVLTINNVSVFTLVLTINNVSVFTLVLTINNVTVFTFRFLQFFHAFFVYDMLLSIGLV